MTSSLMISTEYIHKPTSIIHAQDSGCLDLSLTTVNGGQHTTVNSLPSAAHLLRPNQNSCPCKGFRNFKKNLFKHFSLLFFNFQMFLLS